MHVRLAFSVAIQVDADILLIDEVLAVGDAAFQQKCFDVFNRMRDEGRTIVFVTHDMGSLNRFCHRALLLERGSAVYMGDPHEVADRYLEINFGRQAAPPGDSDVRVGDGEARVVEAWVEDGRGQRCAAVQQGQQICIKALLRFAVQVQDPEASLYVLNDEHRAIVVATSARLHEASGSFQAGDEALFSFAFENVLAPGRYTPLLTLSHKGVGVDLMDRFEGALSFVVTGAEAMGGVIDLPVDVSISRDQKVLAERSSDPVPE